MKSQKYILSVAIFTNISKNHRPPTSRVHVTPLPFLQYYSIPHLQNMYSISIGSILKEINVTAHSGSP